MVKRPDTPPPAEGEPRILCVTLPYPEVEPIDFEADGGTEVVLTQWLAQFIKKESLFYIYWMPRNDKILVSVEREKDGFYNHILGEHRWGTFLKKCPKENEGRVSTIFYSTYGHDRDVQRHGWRQKWIESSWFDDGYCEPFVQPYPRPAYTTDVPEHCRPIPAPRLDGTRPMVGTTEWIAATVSDDTASRASTSSSSTNDSKKRRNKKNPGRLGSLNYV